MGDILGSWWEAEKTWVKAVVAYTDPTAHCAEGKEFWHEGHPAVRLWGGVQDYQGVNARTLANRELYCSAWVGDTFSSTGPSCSIRRLQVGPHVFWLEYRSEESWMSNYGEGTVEVIGVEMGAGFHPSLRYPLHAVDFVIGKEMYAVDLNVAPGISGSGVEKYLPGYEAVEALEFAHREGAWDGQAN